MAPKDRAQRVVKVSFTTWRDLVARLEGPEDTLENVIQRLMAAEDAPSERVRSALRPEEGPPTKGARKAKGNGSRGVSAVTFPPHIVERAARAPLAARVDRPEDSRVASKGLSGVPDGTRIRAQYKGKQFTGRVEDGVVIVDSIKGRTFTSLSAAAEKLIGGTSHLNGWQWWQAQAPGSRDWVPADLLRYGARRRGGELDE